MLVRQAIMFLSILLLVSQGAMPVQAGGLNRTVVILVILDDAGQPCRQGRGVVVGPEGRILTSASLLADKSRGVVKAGDGSLHFLARVLLRDGLQDLALVEVAGGGGKACPLAPPGALKVGDRLRLPAGPEGEPADSETRLAKILPLSPRLTLLKLTPGGLEREPGTPLFNCRGELVGMLHALGGPGENFRSFLGLNRTWLTHAVATLAKEEGPGAVAPNLAVPRADLNFWQGVAASNRLAFKEAQDRFTAALAQPPPLPEAFCGRGVARFHLGDLEGAEKDLQEASRRLPGYALAFLWLGKAREAQRNLPGAREAYQEAVAAAPSLSEAWFRLGELAYLDGQLLMARKYLEQVGDDREDGPRSFWYLGNIARAQKRPEEALRAFQRALRLNPRFFPAYLEAGRLLLLDLGRAQEAVPLLAQAVKLEPQRSLPRYYLALAHLLTWNPGGAWEQYFALQKINPGLAAQLAQTLEWAE